MLLPLLFAAAVQAHTLPRVLVLYDTDGDSTDAFLGALDALGPHPELSWTEEFNWDGTNPPATAYDAVLHLNGTTDEKWMSEEGQAALVAFVEGGGAYIHSAYNPSEVESGDLAGLEPLTLFTHGTFGAGSLVLDAVNGQSGHPIFEDLPLPIAFDAAYDGGGIRAFSSSPALLLMQDAAGNPALAVRELGLGRVVAMHHAGNDGGYGTLEDPDLQLLTRNAIWWAVRCDEDDDDDFTSPCGGADCDDADPAVSSQADERCGGGDEDCDGQTDESDAIDAVIWHLDADGDGYGDPDLVVVGCTAPDGYVADGADCADGDRRTYPGAPEIWYDGTDQSCDGSSDFDADGDGFDSGSWGGEDCDDGDPGTSPPACEGRPADDPDLDGYTDQDCDNHHSGVHPGAEEVWYDGLDADCDGNDDDADGDGVPLHQDCDDADPHVYPGAEDPPYDGVISDCDPAGEFDADADGHDRVPEGEDCDDADPAVHPGAEETWYDGVDADCDGAADDDADGDGVPLHQDCDDRDPQAGLCDTGTAPKERCGCASGATGGGLGLILSLLASGRRRRSGRAAPHGG